MTAAVGVVINPTAGKGRGRHAGIRVMDSLSRHGHDVVDLSGPDYAAALANARAAVAAGGLGLLVVVGGDGMVHLGVNATAGTGLPLGIVAVGTGNDFARAVGLPAGPTPAIDALLDAMTRPPVTLDAALATAGAESRWFGGVLSAGIDAAVNARANAVAWPRGRARYAVAVLTEIARYRPYGYRLRIEGVAGAEPDELAGIGVERDGDAIVWQSPGALVAVGNGTFVGGGIRIAPDARLDDGLLDVVLAGPFTRRGAVRIFPGTYAGRHIQHRGVAVVRARAVLLDRTDQGAAPPPAFADGELIGRLPIRVELRPGALRVLAGIAVPRGPNGRRGNGRSNAPRPVG